MYISRIHVAGIRGFHGRHEVTLDLTRPDGTHAGWTVIAGRNGSGKTSLLRAVTLAVAGADVARSVVTGFENWISLGHSLGESGVRLNWDMAFDGTGGVVRGNAEPVDATLRWVMPEDDGEFQRRGVQPRLSVVADHEMDDGPWQDNPQGWFIAAYGPFRRLTGGDNQRFASAPAAVERLASLFHEDVSLADGVSGLIDQHLRTLEGRPGAGSLRDAALAILGDGLLPDEYQIREVNSEGLWVQDAERSFPLREMSDGYRTVAALVVDLLKQLDAAYGDLSLDTDAPHPRVSLPGVVVVDEVDAHLHVSWQKRIGKWLKAHFPLIQFIVTTHSPYVCQDADQGGLIKLPGRDEPSEAPRVVDHDLYERVVYGSGDDAVLSELFGIDTPFSVEAERLRAELVALEVVTMALREWAEASVAGDSETAREALLIIREEPLADVAQSMLRQALSPGADLVLGDAFDVVTALRDEGLRRALLV